MQPALCLTILPQLPVLDSEAGASFRGPLSPLHALAPAVRPQ